MKILATTLMLLSGCQTINRQPFEHLPRAHEKHFAQCENLSFSRQIGAYKEEVPLIKGYLDWISKPDRFDGEISNVLGQRILAIKKKPHSLRFSKRALNSLIQLDEDDFIIIDGNRIGIRDTDISCLLAGKIPNYLINNLMHTWQSKDKYHYTGSTKQRKINVTISPSKNCLKLSWHNYWIFKKTVKMCQSGDTTTIKLPGDISIKLVEEKSDDEYLGNQ